MTRSSALTCIILILSSPRKDVGEGSGDKLIKGANTKKPKCWKEFLSNDENKHQLIKLILNVWQTN